jgi:hypothetical protein
MDPSGRLQPGAEDVDLSIIDLSGAPPAYARYDYASSSRTSSGRDLLASISTKVHPKPIDYYYSSSNNNNASTSAAMGGRSASKYTKSNSRDQRTSGSRSAPDYSGSIAGEWLSEKDPYGQATQISHASPRSPCGRTPTTSLSRSYYPPTASRDEATSPCDCFNSLPPKVKLWLSFGAWIATSVGFLLAVAFWKTEVFTGLDNLSGWLVEEGYTGYAYMFALIVLTTIRKYLMGTRAQSCQH